jgi:hypothetical protein
MNLNENAAYLKGLFEGLPIDETTPEAKLLAGAVKIIGVMAEQIEALAAECKDLREYIEELDDDLGSVEEEVYGADFDDEDDDDDDEDDDEANFYEATCPSCGEVVCFDDTLDPESITCPACGDKFSCVCDGDCDCCSSDCDKED